MRKSPTHCVVYGIENKKRKKHTTSKFIFVWIQNFICYETDKKFIGAKLLRLNLPM